MLQTIVLMGDSVIDNAFYTQGEPDVTTCLKSLLPSDLSISRFAVDGATTDDIDEQLQKLPGDASHIVLSVGGNDALGNIDVLTLPARSIQDALERVGECTATFEARYRTVLSKVSARTPRLTVCTIYNGFLPTIQAPSARVALMLFNDAILRVAFDFGANVIDLRSVCTEPEDFVNLIELNRPGHLGGSFT